MYRRSSAITVSAFCALALAGAGAVAASAATTPSRGTLTACVNHASGSFYHLTVAPARDKACHRGDVRVRWNQAGVQGPKGATGTAGASGQQGAQGDPGTQGEQGAQGLRGLQGDQGDQGDPGTQGQQGLQGLRGLQGEQGDQGERGFPGEQGVQGDAGAGFAFRNAWDPDHIYNAGDVVVVEGTSYVSLVGLNLDNTPTPSDGHWAVMAARGAQGTAGDAGAQGATGAAGAKGDTGAQGEEGPQGPRGLPGVQGDKGDTGAGFLFRSAWLLEGTYAVDDVVTSGGSTYLSLVGANTGNDPASDHDSWALLAAKGDAGAKGDKGDTGSTGPTGPSVASTRTLTDETIPVGAESPATASVACSAGSVAIGAGWENTNVVIKASYPSASSPDTWNFKFYNAGGSTSVVVHVICIA